MTFGEPFNPNSVEGVQMRRRQAAAIRRRQAAAIRRRKEEEAELVQIDADRGAEHARLAARLPFAKLWDRFFG